VLYIKWFGNFLRNVKSHNFKILNISYWSRSNQHSKGNACQWFNI